MSKEKKKNLKDRFDNIDNDFSCSENQQKQHNTRKPYKRPDNDKIIHAFYECKAIIQDVAKYLNVERTTVYGWINQDKEKGDLTLVNGLELAKEAAHDYVKGKLLSRIDGYDHPEDKIFQFKGTEVIIPTIKHYPPDVEAMKLYFTLEGLLVNKTEIKDTTIDFID